MSDLDTVAPPGMTTLEPLVFFKLKAKLYECALADEQARAMVMKARAERRDAMVAAGLDPMKNYKLEDTPDGLCLATEIVGPPSRENTNG